jgi:hypothetical protein
VAKSRKLTRDERRAKYAVQRHRLSQLKKMGLISPKANLMRDKPSAALLAKERRLRHVFTGFAQPVKLSPKATRDYRDQGYPTYNGYLVIDKQPGEKVKVGKNDELILTSKYNRPGFEQIILPANVRNWPAFHKWITEHHEELQALVGPFGYFGFTFYGNPSRLTGDAEWLIGWLEHYEALFPEEGIDSAEANQAFQHLILYKLKDQEMQSVWRAEAEATREARQSRKRSSRSLSREEVRSVRGVRNPNKPTAAKYQSNYRAMIKSDPKSDRDYRLSEAARKKAYRDAKKHKS